MSNVVGEAKKQPNTFKDVFKFFKEFESYPHGSGNTRAVEDYLVNFALSRSLKYKKDSVGNVVIYKDGDKTRPTLILQAHMDMVAVSDDKEKDMTKKSVEFVEHDGFLSANGTSLGADDGIGVAYILSILDDNTLSLPPIEALFTVDEETSMKGAIGFDMSLLSGKRLINLDSEEEGEVLSSSAGGAHFASEATLSLESMTRKRAEITVKGLHGGHSGAEIDRNGANAIVVLLSVLKELSCKFGLSLYSLEGGEALNIIPKIAKATVFIKNSSEIESAVNSLESEFRKKYSATDPLLSITVESSGLDETVLSSTDDSTFKALSYLTSFPNGVIEMNADKLGLVMTSLNCGKIQFECGKCENRAAFIYSIRSNSDKKRDEFVESLKEKAIKQNAPYVIDAIYPSWVYKPSALRDKMREVYASMYGSPMKETIVHAGLECGYFVSKCRELDTASIGPNMSGVHTTSEKLDLKSAERVYEYLKKVLEVI